MDDNIITKIEHRNEKFTKAHGINENDIGKQIYNRTKKWMAGKCDTLISYTLMVSETLEK